MARLSDEQIEERPAGLQGWRREGEAIRRESGNTVTVTLSTHSEGGLSENDFELAREIEGVERSHGG
jgi:pterin-4a-carbinolamine dehydratase